MIPFVAFVWWVFGVWGWIDLQDARDRIRQLERKNLDLEGRLAREENRACDHDSGSIYT